MKRRIAQLIVQLTSLIFGACMAGMAVAVVLFMIKKVQDAMTGGHSMQMVFEILALAGFAFILGILALLLWGIVNFERRIAWLYISSFVGLLVWVLYEEIREAIAEGRLMQMLLMWAFVLVGGIVFLAGVALVFLGIEKLRLQIRKWWFRLLTGVTMETALRESPYELAHFQGEGDYRVVDKRTGEFVDWKDPDGAEAWILRQYVKQRRNERRNRTSG